MSHIPPRARTGPRPTRDPAREWAIIFPTPCFFAVAKHSALDSRSVDGAAFAVTSASADPSAVSLPQNCALVVPVVVADAHFVFAPIVSVAPVSVRKLENTESDAVFGK